MKAAIIWLLGGTFLAFVGCDGFSTSLPGTTPETRVVRDTTFMDGDTVQRIVMSTYEGDALRRRDTATSPVTEFVWIRNGYGSDAILDVWAGDSLEWRNGHILGFQIHQLPDSRTSISPLAVGKTRRIGPRYQKELLVLAGIPSGSGADFLTLRRFRDVSAGDTIYLDSRGLLQIRR